VPAEGNGRIQVDDQYVGDGYGIPTEASREALRLAAETEGLILDPVYTAKAMAGLIAYVRAGRFTSDQTVLFWHTGGVPGLFA
jgi:1-aminocyclopropane-1-carboxylate deaminase/D-cysteine desulfhydrase-like pyridoxal-dependent ACC family enzyme